MTPGARRSPEAGDGGPRAGLRAQGPEPRPRGELYLQPGRLFVSAQPYTVRTILGSCVSVCLFDPRRAAGGLNHYLLPHRLGDGESSTRFGEVAVQRLIGAMLALGSQRVQLQAKVFGGAHVLRPGPDRAGDLGAQNAALALELLAAERIPVVAQDLGGERSRKLIFRTDDGSAFIRRL
jgi:chemotaxis protein CheD